MSSNLKKLDEAYSRDPKLSVDNIESKPIGMQFRSSWQSMAPPIASAELGKIDSSTLALEMLQFEQNKLGKNSRLTMHRKGKLTHKV